MTDIDLPLPEADLPLKGLRVLAAINGLELFGHERGNIEVFKALRRAGAEVVVGVNAREGCGSVSVELERIGFPRVAIPFGPPWSSKFLRGEPSLLVTAPLAVLRSSYRFACAMQRVKPNCVHLGSPLAYSYLALALGLRQVPLVFRMGDCPPLQSRFNMQLWRSAMRRSTRIVANSEFVRKSAIAAGVHGDKLSVIYNMAPKSDVGVDDVGGTIRKSSQRMLYVGAVARHKGLIELVDALAGLSEEFPTLELDILGGSKWDSSFRVELVARIERLRLHNRVDFYGHVRDPIPYFQRAPIHIAPSLCDEAGANVVMEAKQAGTASVVFPSGGLPEIVRHGVDGYVCESRTVKALIDGIRFLLADPDRLKRMGEAARADYLSRFDELRFTQQWTAIYCSVMRTAESDR